MNLNELLVDCKKLDPISYELATAIYHKQNDLIDQVNHKMASLENIDALIGGNPEYMMNDNHRHHLLFMVNVFNLNFFEMMVRTVAWVYSSYSSHGFNFDYFIYELKTWIEVYENEFEPEFVKPVTDVYRWLLQHHEDFCQISREENSTNKPKTDEWFVIKQEFLGALLAGDHRTCVKLASASISNSDDMEKFYLQVIKEAMYEIGYFWQQAKITTAQEHLASAIVTRVMTSINLLDIPRNSKKGKAIVTASTNEYHEIGSWIFADLLDQDGWDVDYLGANTPADSVISLAKKIKPVFVAISVTMPFNLFFLKNFIKLLRSDAELCNLKLMVGGKVFQEFPDLWKEIGADGCANDAVSGRNLARNWWKECNVA